MTVEREPTCDDFHVQMYDRLTVLAELLRACRRPTSPQELLDRLADRIGERVHLRTVSRMLALLERLGLAERRRERRTLFAPRQAIAAAPVACPHCLLDSLGVAVAGGGDHE